MSRMGIVSVMLDTSFCIRLMDANDNLHAHALEYFRFFLQEKITIHLSTIVALNMLWVMIRKPAFKQSTN